MESIIGDFSVRMTLPVEVVIARLIGAALVGGIIGLEREWHDRPAGFRTHILVALAAAVFTVLTSEMVHSDFITSENVQADPVRVVEAVTAGVAFLAAGAIIQARGRVRGLTTGAGMWLAGALGVAVGLGEWLIAGVATLIALAVNIVLRSIEKSVLKRRPSSEHDGKQQG